MIKNKETSPPEIDDLKEVVRRIYVGSSDDFITIQYIDNIPDCEDCIAELILTADEYI